MAMFILKRILWSLPTLVLISIATFIIIQLPPGDYVTAYIAELEETGESISAQEAAELRAAFGLDRPLIVQYWDWISGIVFRGDFGLSLDWKLPVSDLLWDRIALTLMISTLSLVLTWAIAISAHVIHSSDKPKR